MEFTVLNALLKSLANSGMVGAVLALMLWFNFNLVKKLFKVIETNTEINTKSVAIQKESIEVIEKNSEAFKDFSNSVKKCEAV